MHSFPHLTTIVKVLGPTRTERRAQLPSVMIAHAGGRNVTKERPRKGYFILSICCSRETLRSAGRKLASMEFAASSRRCSWVKPKEA